MREPVLFSIVDDDAFAGNAIAQLIESLGYKAITFQSAEQFLESGHIRETACLITDMRMPGMTGFDLQRYMRNEGYLTPIIFVSAFPEESFRTRARESGAVAFLSKPFEENALIASIDIALSGTDSKPSLA